MTISVRALVVRLVLIVVLCGVLGFGGVLDGTHAALLGCILSAAVLMGARTPGEPDAEWPIRPVRGRAGGRDQVSNLSWQAFDQDGLVRRQVVHRVGAIAASRLALLGVDAEDPTQQADVERLLGARVASGLASGQRPTARTLQTWLDAIDRLTDERTTR